MNFSGPGAADPKNELHSNNSQNLRITSENQWRTFANSLAAEGLVVEIDEQQQLQKLWDRAVVGANSFGRKYVQLAESFHPWFCAHVRLI